MNGKNIIFDFSKGRSFVIVSIKPFQLGTSFLVVLCRMKSVNDNMLNLLSTVQIRLISSAIILCRLGFDIAGKC